MANHTIEVLNKGNYGTPKSQETTASGVDSNMSRAPKATSAKNQFVNRYRKGLKFVNIASSLNVSGAISMAGGGVGLTMATLNTSKSSLQRGTNLYFDYMTASSGEDMRYQNKKNLIGLMVNPVSTAKKFFWDYGILETKRIARQNEMLDYNRQLTNNVAFSRSMQKGQF